MRTTEVHERAPLARRQVQQPRQGACMARATAQPRRGEATPTPEASNGVRMLCAYTGHNNCSARIDASVRAQAAHTGMPRRMRRTGEAPEAAQGSKTIPAASC